MHLESKTNQFEIVFKSLGKHTLLHNSEYKKVF